MTLSRLQLFGSGIIFLLLTMLIFGEEVLGHFHYLRAETAVIHWLQDNAPDQATLAASRHIRWRSRLAPNPDGSDQAAILQHLPDYVVTDQRLSDQLLTQHSQFRLRYVAVAQMNGGQNGRFPLTIWQKQPLPNPQHPLVAYTVRVPALAEWHGYQQWPSRLQPGAVVEVVLLGERPFVHPPLSAWQASLRLTSLVDGQRLAEADFPLEPADENGRLQQPLRLVTPTDLPPGAYQVEVAFRQRDAASDVLLIEHNDIQRVFDRWLLAPVIVPWQGEIAEGSQPINANFDAQIWLRAAETAVADGHLSLTLYWEAQRPPDFNYTIFVHLLNEAGEWVAGRDVQPLDGRYPTRLWQPAELVRDEHVVPLPPDLAAGSYQLHVGLYRVTTGERLPVLDAAQVAQPNGSLLLQTVPVP